MNMIDKNTMKKHFNRNSTTYDQYAKIQRKMAANLIEIIMDESLCVRHCVDPLRVLDVGCGTGILTNLFSENFPSVKIVAVDVADGMLKVAQSKLAGRNVDFICADVEELNIDQKFDFIISNATFQWFCNTEQTIAKLMKLLNPNGYMCFSTFGSDTFCELHKAFRIAKKGSHIYDAVAPGHKLYSLNELYDMCRKTVKYGSCIQYRETREQHYFGSVMEFLKSVKKIGANNSNVIRSGNVGLTHEMIKIYQQRYGMHASGVPATYHCIYFCMQNIK